MTAGLDVLINTWRALVFIRSRTKSAKYGASIFVNVGVNVLTRVLLSNLLAQTKLGGVINSESCSQSCLGKLSMSIGANQHRIRRQNIRETVLPTRTKFMFKPPSPPCWHTSLHVSVCSATCWGLAQPEDKAKEARWHLIKAWQASKICCRGCHELLHAFSSRTVQRHCCACFSKWIDVQARQTWSLLAVLNQILAFYDNSDHCIPIVSLC